MKTKHLATKNKTKPGGAGSPSGRAPGQKLGAHLTTAISPERRGSEPGERLLTAEDISARLFIKPRTAALWARQGRLPAYRSGRKWLFKWEEVQLALPTVGHRGEQLKNQNESACRTGH